MLDRLSTSKEAAQAFAALALSGNKALLLIDACMEAHRLDTGEHEAQVERLRRFPDYKETQAKQAELELRVKDFGALTEDVRAAFDVIRATLPCTMTYGNSICGRPPQGRQSVGALPGDRIVLRSPCAFVGAGRTFGT